jgi:hypothetical protein
MGNYRIEEFYRTYTNKLVYVLYKISGNVVLVKMVCYQLMLLFITSLYNGALF